MDITNNKYIRFVFDDLGKVPGRRYSSLLYRKLVQDRTLSKQDKGRIEIAIALLKMNGYVEEKKGSSPVMNLVLATEDKGNKVIEYGKRVEIAVDLLDLIPYKEDRKNHGKVLYDLTGDNNSFFPTTDETVKAAISEVGINLPSTITDRIDIYDWLMQQTEKPIYEKFLNILSDKIENQGNEVLDEHILDIVTSPAVTNVNISNPIIIENMTDSKIRTTDKSKVTNVTVNGNDNQVVTGSRDTKIDNAKSAKSSQHWLQIIYWIVGIGLAFIGIYKFFIE